MGRIRHEIKVKYDSENRPVDILASDNVPMNIVRAEVNATSGGIVFSGGELPATSLANDSAAMLALFGNTENKVVAKTDSNSYYISVPKAGTRKTALVYEIKQGSITSTDSQGGAGEFFRVTKVTEVVRSMVAKHEPSAVNSAGDWTQVTYNLPGQAGAYGIGSWGTSVKHRQTTVQNAWVEFSTVVGDSGQFTVGFQVAPGQSASVKVSINGVDVDTFSTVGSSSMLWLKQYSAAPGTHTVRVTKLDAGSLPLRCFGTNLYDAADLPAGNGIDSWAYGRTANFYKSNVGAIDYAMRSVVGDKWCGSYHGGETRTALAVLVDDVDISASATGTIAVGRDVIIDQTTSVDTGAGAVAVSSRHRWQQSGGHAFSALADCGAAEMSFFYTLMAVLEPSFAECVYPVARDYTAQATQRKDAVGPTEMIVMRNPTTGQRSAVWCRQFSVEENAYGGAHLWHHPGTYTKPYNGPAVESDGAVLGKFSWTALHAYF